MPIATNWTAFNKDTKICPHLRAFPLLIFRFVAASSPQVQAE